MIRHGSSHGLAVLVCSVVSALIIDHVREIYPAFHLQFIQFSTWLIVSTGVSLNPHLTSTILLAVFLGVVWGIAFKLTARS